MENTHKRKNISEHLVELEIVIPSKAFKTSYDALVAQQTKEVKMDGFRQGSVPKEVIEGKMRDELLLKTFERVAPIYISQAVSQEGLDVIAPPDYKSLPQLNSDDDLRFTIEVTIMPKFTLGDLKKVKFEEKEVNVEQKEVDDLITQMEGNEEVKAERGTDKWAAEVAAKLAFQGIKSMDELKAEIKRLLGVQKEDLIKRERESEALKQAIELSKIEIPQKAVEYEASERESSFMHELEHRGTSLDDFLKQSGVTLEKMREMWMKDAKDAIEADEFLLLYSKEKAVTLTPEEIDAEVEKVRAANPGVNPATYDNAEWRNYIQRIALKQKAFESFMKEVFGKDKELVS